MGSDDVELSDAELLEAYRGGDLGAFDHLYSRHKERVVALAFRFCGNEPDALDVLQDAFVYVVEKRDLELRGKLTTLLYPVIKNLSIARCQRQRRVESLDADLEDGSVVLPGVSGQMQEMLAGLSAIQQEILALRFGDGLALAEIADHLQIPLGTVKSRLHAGLQSLRERGDTSG